MAMSELGKSCAVVIGGSVNGYSIIQELHRFGVADIALLEIGLQPARRSRFITDCFDIELTAESLAYALKSLHRKYALLVLYPTDEYHLELCGEIEDKIRDFCFIPSDLKRMMELQDKSVQVRLCAEQEVPCPPGVVLDGAASLCRLRQLELPIIVKPIKRYRFAGLPDFRKNYIVRTYEDIPTVSRELERWMAEGCRFLASEIIPGDGPGLLYAYNAYCTKNGKITHEWCGRKLSQYPDEFGVFSSASNETANDLCRQGRKLVSAMQLPGIIQAEFKYNAHDGKLYFIEFSFRSDMWSRVGTLSGVHLQYAQWCEANGLPFLDEKQDVSRIVHFCNLSFEIENLFRREKYWKIFRHNVFGGDRFAAAFCSIDDPMPFLTTLKSILRLIARRLFHRHMG